MNKSKQNYVNGVGPVKAKQINAKVIQLKMEK